MMRFTRISAAFSVAAALVAAGSVTAPTVSAAPPDAASNVAVASTSGLDVLFNAPVTSVAPAKRGGGTNYGSASPSASATPSPTPTPVTKVTTTWKYDANLGKTGWVFLNSGAFYYTSTPADQWGPDGNFAYTARGTAGSWPTKSPTGKCEGLPDVLTAQPVTWSDGCASNWTYLRCALTTDPPGMAFQPMANYAYAAPWKTDVRYFQHREPKYTVTTPTLNGKVIDRFETATNQTRVVRDGMTDDFRNTYYPCQFHAAPYATYTECPVSEGPISIDGPFGRELPTVSDYTGKVIPQSVRRQWQVRNGNGSLWSDTSPLGLAYNSGGSRLSTVSNARAVSLVESCRGWNPSIPPTNLTYFGNYQIDREQTTVTCKVIYYPGFGTANFQECVNREDATVTEFKIVTCNPNNPDNPIVRTAGSPDRQQGFSPQSMKCHDVICRWNNQRESETGLPDRNNGNGTALVWSDQNPDLLLRPGNTTGRIYTIANGYTLHVQAPILTMRVVTPGTNSPPTDAGLKWTFFEVNPGSTPWQTIDGERVANPNANGQPFSSRFRNEKGVLSVPKAADDNDAFCVDGDANKCVTVDRLRRSLGPRASLTSRNDITPIVLNNNSWARDLLLNFYKPSSTSNLGEFGVRGVYAQTWTETMGLPTLTNVNVSGLLAGRTHDETFTVTHTCSTEWTNFTVLKDRTVGQ